MANENPLVKAISLNSPIAPEYQQQLLQAQRQQEIAKLLMQRGLTPGDPNQMVSGIVVKKGLGDGLLQLANAYLGKKTQDAADKTLADAQTSYTNSVRQMFAPQQDPAALGQALSNGAGPTNENAAAMAQALQQDQGFKRLPGDNTGQLSAMMYMADPSKYAEKMADYAAPTSEMKNNQWMGISPDQARANVLAKAVADGSIKVGGGETVINPATGQPLYVGPDFKNGVAGGFNAQGQPVMGAIQGAEVLPQMAGMQKEAEARASAGYSPVTVPTEGAPTMTTARALADSVNPAASTAATPNPMQVPADVQAQRDQIRMGLLQEELQKAQTSGNQSVVNDLMKEIQATRAPQGQQLPGIKLANSGKQEVLQSLNKDRLSSMQKSAQQVQGQLNAIAEMKRFMDDPAMKGSVLGDGLLDQAKMAAGDKFSSLRGDDYVRTAGFKALASKMAIPEGGLGNQISDADRKALERSYFDLQNATTDAQRRTAIDSLERTGSRVMQQMNEALSSYEKTGKLPQYVGATASFEAPKQAAAPQAFNSIPNPAQYAGKMLRDPSTGQRLRSDGKNWIKVQ